MYIGFLSSTSGFQSEEVR